APVAVPWCSSSIQSDRGAEELPRSRFCSACSNATLRGAESSHVRLTADSPVPRRIDVARATAGAMLAHFHAARVAPTAMRNTSQSDRILSSAATLPKTVSTSWLHAGNHRPCRGADPFSEVLPRGSKPRGGQRRAVGVQHVGIEAGEPSQQSIPELAVTILFNSNTVRRSRS